MGDFKIYADALEHPLLQRFNDLLNLLSLSHYVSFPSCKIDHTLVLGMLLNLHHGNILFFIFRSHLFLHCGLAEDFPPFPCFSCCIHQLRGAQSVTCMKTVLRASQSPFPGPSVSLLVDPSMSSSLSSTGFWLAIPFPSFIWFHVLSSTQWSCWYLLLFSPMKLRVTFLYFCKQRLDYFILFCWFALF